MLWAEADRMGGLAITQENLENQQGVVQNEVKVNVFNRPYGGSRGSICRRTRTRNWYNAHNFYGDLRELDAATLEDATALLQDLTTRPNNAALVGRRRLRLRRRRSDGSRSISAGVPQPIAAAPAESREPRQTKEKRAEQERCAAPASGAGHRLPHAGSLDAGVVAMGLIDQILVQGRGQRALRRSW